jgi:hypothetical protein
MCSTEKPGFFSSLRRKMSRPSSTIQNADQQHQSEPPPAYTETEAPRLSSRLPRDHNGTPVFNSFSRSSYGRSPTASSQTGGQQQLPRSPVPQDMAPNSFARSPTGPSSSWANSGSSNRNNNNNNPFVSVVSPPPPQQTTPYPPSPGMLHPGTMPPQSKLAPSSSPYNNVTAKMSSLSVNSRSSVITRESLSTDSDPYAFLSTFDTVFLIDDSGSMRLKDRGATKSRWEQARACIERIAPICTAHDDDGLDIYFINHKSGQPAEPANGKGADGYLHTQHSHEVKEIFSIAAPTGGTLTGRRLRGILQPYVAYLERHSDDLDACKPLNVIVITDGQAQDDVESVIVSTARKLDALDAAPYQLGVQFFQVGSDRGATEALRELDDDLQDRAGVRDIVDTCPMQVGPDGAEMELSGEAILKTVLGAVVKKLDRKVVEQQ